ncbi:MAG: 6-bladed beta-propeller [Bacteroidales bacterium]|jgi:hypothetical protein|nr:6-bladed beta-propeller [Bacteroidales bacterium]
MKIYFVLLFFLSLIACTSEGRYKNSEHSSPVYIKINKPNIASLQPLYLSEFVDSIEYVQLETTNECLLSYVGNIECVDDNLFVIDRGAIFQFDMKTGKFIRRIGKTGQGPGEYILLGYGIDKENHKIFVRSQSSQSPMSFDFDGNYLGNLKDSLLISCWGAMSRFSAGNGYLIYANVPVNASDQWACQPYELMIYNYINHQMIPGLTNRLECQFTTYYQEINPGTQMLLKQDEMHFYKSFYNDTLYTVNGKGIFPYAVIDLGSRKYPSDLLWTNGMLPIGKIGKILIRDVYICPDYFLVECSLINDENLRNSNFFVCKYNRNTGDLTYHTYIINDMDGGNIMAIGSLRRGIGEATLPIQDSETEQNAERPDQIQLKHPELKEKFEIMQENRNEDDNPILMILHKMKN